MRADMRPVRVGDDVILRGAGAAARSTTRPVRRTRMRWASRSTSGRSDDAIKMATPRAAERADERVDLFARADVDAARGLVEQEHARRAMQPLSEHDLLLIAARQRRDRRVGAAADAQLVDARVRASASAASPSASAERQRQVLGDRQPEDEAAPFAIFGHEREAGGDGVARRVELDARAVDEDLAGHARVGAAEERREQRGAARAHGAGERDDFARATVNETSIERAFDADVRAARAPLARGRGVGGRWRASRGEVAADHHAHDFARSSRRGRRRCRRCGRRAGR